jgi:hypothetical protein
MSKVDTLSRKSSVFGQNGPEGAREAKNWKFHGTALTEMHPWGVEELQPKQGVSSILERSSTKENYPEIVSHRHFTRARGEKWSLWPDFRQKR